MSTLKKVHSQLWHCAVTPSYPSNCDVNSMSNHQPLACCGKMDLGGGKKEKKRGRRTKRTMRAKGDAECHDEFSVCKNIAIWLTMPICLRESLRVYCLGDRYARRVS